MRTPSRCTHKKFWLQLNHLPQSFWDNSTPYRIFVLLKPKVYDTIADMSREIERRSVKNLKTPTPEEVIITARTNKYYLTRPNFIDAITAEGFVAQTMVEAEAAERKLIKKSFWERFNWWKQRKVAIVERRSSYVDYVECHLLKTEPSVRSNTSWQIYYPDFDKNADYIRKKGGYSAYYSEDHVGPDKFDFIRLGSNNINHNTHIQPFILKGLLRMVGLRIFDQPHGKPPWSSPYKVIATHILREDDDLSVDTRVVVFQYGDNPNLIHYLNFKLSASHNTLRINEMEKTAQSDQQ